MKVTIEFDGFEEKEELREALDGYKWKGLVVDLEEELRKLNEQKFGILVEETEVPIITETPDIPEIKRLSYTKR